MKINNAAIGIASAQLRISESDVRVAVFAYLNALPKKKTATKTVEQLTEITGSLTEKIESLGNGYYLVGGVKYHGKAKAIAALEAASG